jgi:hypothetical protein
MHTSHKSWLMVTQQKRKRGEAIVWWRVTGWFSLLRARQPYDLLHLSAHLSNKLTRPCSWLRPTVSLVSWGRIRLSPRVHWPLFAYCTSPRWWWWVWNSRWNENCHFFHHKSHITWPVLEPGPRGGKPATAQKNGYCSERMPFLVALAIHLIIIYIIHYNIFNTVNFNKM